MTIVSVLSSLLKPMNCPTLRGAEVGVFRGDSSRGLLESHPQLFLYMVDTWSVPDPASPYFNSHDKASRQHWAQQMANEQVAYSQTEFAAERRVLLRSPSAIAARAITDGSLDFAFIDADHTYEGVSADLRAWWPKVRPGGLFSGHDYGARKNRRGVWGVDRAVNEFVAAHRLTLGRGSSNVWWVQKPGAAECAQQQTANGAGTVVRVVFGEMDDRPKLRGEIARALERTWDQQEVRHFVAGKSNAEWIRELGAQHVELLDERALPLSASRLGLWYTKAWLLFHAQRAHREILAIDFDCRIVRPPDERMWSLLRSNRGRFGGAFQAANVGYRRTMLPPFYRDPKVYPRRQFLSSSLLYCREPSWLWGWRQGFEDLLAHGIAPERFTDEPPLLLSLDREYGPMSPQEMVVNFEIPIQQHGRSTPEARATKCQNDIYFAHA